MSIKEEEEKSKLSESWDLDSPLAEDFDIVLSSKAGNERAHNKGRGFQSPLYLVIILLVAIVSFGLGKMVYLESQSLSAPVRLESLPPLTAGSVPGDADSVSDMGEIQGATASGSVVASKNSDKYHALWCPGAQRIAEANKVFYDSPEDARKAGLTPAANCKGLR